MPSPSPLAAAAPQRVAVHGASGSGKTTLARSLARALDAAHLELDGLYHQAGWSPLDPADFRARVEEFVGQSRWVVDGNYRLVRDLVWSRADAVVLVDLSRARVTSRVVRRTLGRLFARTELWNGNHESWRNVLSLDPERNIVRWSWTTYAHYHGPFADEVRRVAPHARLVVLRTPRHVRAFLRSAADRGVSA